MAIQFGNDLKPKGKPIRQNEAIDMIVKARKAVQSGQFKTFEEAIMSMYPDVNDRGLDMGSKPAQPKQPSSNSFNKWFDTFVSEKGINPDEPFEHDGPSGKNMMNYGVIFEHIKGTTPQEQKKIKDQLVRLDFQNANVGDYFKHLGKGIVK